MLRHTLTTTHTCGLRVHNDHGCETIDRYACLGLVRMQRGNRSSRNSKTSETEYSAHCPVKHSTDDTEFHYIFTFGRCTSICHYYLLTVFLEYFVFFHFLTSHIRSFVHFASIYSSSPHLFGIGRRHTNYPFLFLLSILSCAHSHRIREFCESVDKKGALYRWELVLGCRVRRARISVCVIWYARMCVGKFLFLLRSNGVSVRA